MSAMPAELAALPAMVALELQLNPLHLAAEEAWAPLAQCSSLTFLDLHNIPFARLPPALAALAPHLVSLDLHRTTGGGLWAGGEATLGPLYQLSGLTQLTLWSCMEDHPLPEGLSCLVGLRDLDLSNNGTLGDGVALHPLRRLTALTRLELGSCKLNDLPEELLHLQALKDLDFGYNHTPVHYLEDISWQRLRGLTALTRLNLEACNLKRLPPELAELRSLADQNISGNYLLSGCSGYCYQMGGAGGADCLDTP